MQSMSTIVCQNTIQKRGQRWRNTSPFPLIQILSSVFLEGYQGRLAFDPMDQMEKQPLLGKSLDVKASGGSPQKEEKANTHWMNVFGASTTTLIILYYAACSSSMLVINKANIIGMI